VLDNVTSCRIFKEFLEHECAAQTLMFLIDVEEYCRIPSAAFQQKISRKIYNKFIHELAIMPIPISKETRQEITDCVIGQKMFNAPTLFTQANDEVMRYIETYQFSKFARTPDMAKAVALLNRESVEVNTKLTNN
jgi:hypothetical protein